MKITIDTNVILAGLQSNKGYSYRLLQMLGESQIKPCLSVPLFLEYESQTKKHLSPLIFSDEEIDDFLDYLCSVSEKVSIYYLWRPYLKDPFDDHVLEVAINSGSQYIITFNKKDFKDLHEFGIHVVNPKEFCLLLEERSTNGNAEC